MMQFHSIFSLLLLLCLLHLCTEAKSAELSDPPVTLDKRQAPVGEVLADITRQTKVSFSYEPSVLEHFPLVTLRIEKKPLSECLQLLFRGTSVTYLRSGRFVILKRKPKEVTISGFVRDEASSESLPGASVYDAESRRGTSTNADGFFSLTLETKKNIRLNISYVGYDALRLSFDSLERDTLLPVRLTTRQQLAEVVVTGEQSAASFLSDTDMGHTRLNPNAIRNTPVVFGEADIVKTLQTLPGVTAGTAGLAGMYVRGGSGDDNLYMIEGNPLYQVNHVGGLFSAFNAEAVKDVEFFKSAFPARYGGRLSGVIDVHSKDGNTKEYHGSAMLGLTSGSLNLEGPLVKDRTSFHFALRRSWLDALTAPAIAIWNATRKEGETKLVARYAFTDLNLKVNHLLNERNRLYAGLYGGNDFLKGGEKRSGSQDYESENTGRLRWGNFMAFAGWTGMLGNRLFGRLNAAYTHYASELKGNYYEGTPEHHVSNSSFMRNRIDDFSLRARLDYSPHAAHRLYFGADYVHHRFHPADESSRFVNGSTTLTIQNEYAALPAHEAGIYAEENWTMNSRMRLHAGLRFSLYAVSGKTYTHTEPRLSARYLVTPQLSIKASYARMSQYVHKISDSYIDLPTDTWMPITRRLRPMTSDQLSTGIYYHTPTHSWSFSAEGYYKWMDHLLEYKDGYQFLPASTSWDNKLAQGSGRSYGIELSAAKDIGQLTGRIGYTLSWNDRQFAEVNKGKRYPAKFDNRHKLNIVLLWKINPKTELSGSWIYQTGNRLTVSFENYLPAGSGEYMNPYYPAADSNLTPPLIEPNQLNYYTERNNYRLPAYHRLDVGLNLYRPKKHGRMGIWNISLYNAYCYMAPVSIHKRYWSNADCYFEKLGLIPTIPSVSYTYKF